MIRLPNVLMPPLGILHPVSYNGGIGEVVGVYARDSHDEKKPQPRLHVGCCLPDVIPSPLPRDDAHLVSPETFHGDDFLAVGEEFGFHWGVGHEEED